MGDIRTSANASFRDYAVAGVPASGPHEPVKSEVRTTFGVVEDEIEEVRALADSAAVGRRTTTSVRVRSTANVTIASALENGDTLNGVTLATADRVFLGSQTAPAENGIYVVPASGAATRATDADSAADLALVEFLVRSGTVGAGETWHLPLEADAITVGSTALNFVQTGIEVDYAAQVDALQATVDEQLTAQVVGTAPAGSGSTVDNTSTVYYWPAGEEDFDQRLQMIEAGFVSDAAFTVVIAEVEGDGTLTFVSEHFVRLVSGVASGLDIDVPAGCIVGAKIERASTWRFVSGTDPDGKIQWSTAATPTTSTAKSILTTNLPSWRVTLAGTTLGLAEGAHAKAEALTAAVGEIVTVGWPDPIVTTGTDTPAGFTVFPVPPRTADSWLTEVQIGADGVGTATIMVVTIAGGVVTDIISETTVPLANAVNVLPVDIFVPAGAFVGISGGGYKYQDNTNPLHYQVWLKSTKPGVSDTVALNGAHRYEIAFTLRSGLEADAYRALNGDIEGLDGLTPDADALTLAEARYGLWGPGEVTVDGERFFLPSVPQATNLYDGIRAALVEHIAAGDVLTLIGDSISHFAFSGTGPAHFFNMVTRFANLGIAADEPIMTALRSSSSYTPAFYGVTYTGTVTTGTRGPIGESAILASGAVLTFTGAYERIGVFYTQQSGAGSLAFAYNGGSAFHTVNAAGSTALDQLASDVTGETASGTFTITASGGPVEITGLIREGVKTSGSPPRLRTLRAAHGSYTFASFNAPAVASILAQAAHAGGVCVPILALGINDSFGTAPATIVTNATAIIDALELAGVERIFAIPPIRPASPTWDASYTGGRTYDGAAGPLRRLYRERGVHVIPADMLDWVGEGLFTDGLHPNPAGNVRMAQVLIEGIVQAA